MIALHDESRLEAAEMIRELHRESVEVRILTADNEETAQTIATEFEIDLMDCEQVNVYVVGVNLVVELS